MSLGSRSTIILLTLTVCAFASNTTAATKRKHAKPVKQEQPAPAPAIVETPPPAPLTPEQMPAVPPTVTYQNGKLTIVAENSNLGDILRAVRKQTGASVDLPPNANSRVVAHLGPGPSRDVLVSLLNGTLFNYVLLGTVNDPSAVGKIILTQKPSGDGQSAANIQPNMGQQPGQNYPAVNAPGQSPDDQEADQETEVEQPQPDQPEQPAEPPSGQQPNLRTPEQLLQELQRQQQLQQQQQQQQGNVPGNQVPQPNPEQ